jgi:hypothetical protein
VRSSGSSIERQAEGSYPGAEAPQSARKACGQARDVPKRRGKCDIRGERDLASRRMWPWKSAPAQEQPPAHSVPSEAQREARRARYVLRLALNPGLWVRRRVETFEFVDGDTIRRRMSVDFALPPARGIAEGDLVYVPLLLPTKGKLRNFDVRDAEGRALSVSTQQHDRAIAVEGLLAYLQALKGAPLEDVSTLREIVEEVDGDTAAATAEQALSAGEIGRILERLPAAGPEDDPERERRERENVRGLLLDLTGSFLLLVHLPHSSRRTIVKVAFDAAHRNRTDGERWFLRASYRLNRPLSSLGLVARIERFESLDVGLGESYHAELVQPADTYASELRLEVRHGKSSRYETVDADDHHVRPHVYTRATARADAGRLTVLLYASREGLLLPLWLSAGLITTVLMLVPAHAEQVEAQTLAALLLLPAALAAYYVRSGEERYLTRMLRGVRLVALVPVLCGLLTAVLLALGPLAPDGRPHGVDAGRAVRDVRWVSLAATLLLTLAVASPWVGVRARPHMRRLNERAMEWTARRRQTYLILTAALQGAAVAIGAYYAIRQLLSLLS